MIDSGQLDDRRSEELASKEPADTLRTESAPRESPAQLDLPADPPFAPEEKKVPGAAERAAERAAEKRTVYRGGADTFPFAVTVGHVYDGPLDLLLDLIRKQDIDIYDIPIATITGQFLAYVENLKQSDVDSAAIHLHGFAVDPHQEQDAAATPQRRYC